MKTTSKELKISGEDRTILRSLRGNDEYKTIFKLFAMARENLKNDLLQSKLTQKSFADVSIALSRYQAVDETIIKVLRLVDEYASINEQ